MPVDARARSIAATSSQKSPNRGSGGRKPNSSPSRISTRARCESARALPGGASATAIASCARRARIGELRRVGPHRLRRGRRGSTAASAGRSGCRRARGTAGRGAAASDRSATRRRLGRAAARSPPRVPRPRSEHAREPAALVAIVGERAARPRAAARPRRQIAFHGSSYAACNSARRRARRRRASREALRDRGVASSDRAGHNGFAIARGR